MARTSAQQKLGKRIRQLRHEAGWSQERLGELTNLDRTYISGIERGIRNPSIRNIEKLARALKVRAGELLKDL